MSTLILTCSTLRRAVGLRSEDKGKTFQKSGGMVQRQMVLETRLAVTSCSQGIATLNALTKGNMVTLSLVYPVKTIPVMQPMFPFVTEGASRQ